MKVDVEFNSSAEYTAEGLIETGIAAEKHGFDGVWKGEANSKDPIVVLSALSQRTESVDLGSAILHPYSKTPSMAGEMAATLNDISNGRFILGIGAGTPAIASWHGKEMYDSPLTSVKEFVEMNREILQEGHVDYDGEYFSADDFTLAFDPPENSRIYVAALGPKMAELAGQLGDGVIGNNAPPEHIRKVRKRALEGAEKAGKDPEKFDITCKIRCSYHEDKSVAKDSLRKVITFYSLADFYERMFSNLGFEEEIDEIHDAYDRGGFDAAKQQVSDEMFERLPFVAASSRQEILDRVERFEEIGVTRIILAYVPNSQTPTEEGIEFLEMMDL